MICVNYLFLRVFLDCIGVCERNRMMMLAPGSPGSQRTIPSVSDVETGSRACSKASIEGDLVCGLA